MQTWICCGHSCVLVQPCVVRFITGGVAAHQAAQEEQRGEAEDVHGTILAPVLVKIMIQKTDAHAAGYVIVMLKTDTAPGRKSYCSSISTG